MKSALWSSLLGILSFAVSLDAAQMKSQAPNLGELRIFAVEATPEPDNVHVSLLFPDADIRTKTPVNIESRIEGFALGTDSDFPRENEIFNDPEGQAMHILIDNEPYFAINEAFIDSLDPHEHFFSQTMDFNIPFALKPGMHVVRIFPVRSFNESLKGDDCFVARVFYWKTKKEMSDVDLSAPYLTYNEPQGEYDFDTKTPILLDFYITNCQLSSDGFKVRLSIDGHVERTLTQWVPYYIYGLKKGSHQIRLELLDPENKKIPGLFNDTTRTIRIK